MAWVGWGASARSGIIPDCRPAKSARLTRLSMKRITHYGITDLAYCGFLLVGFHAEARAGRIDFEVARGLPDELRAAAGCGENMQMISMFEASDGRERLRFCVDNHDKSDYVHPGLIRLVDFYFKGNHNPEAVAALDLDPVLSAKVRPLGAPFAPVQVPWWVHRPPLREVPEAGWDRRSMGRRARQLRRLPTVDFLRSLRSSEKNHDVSFVVRLYRQQHHSPINDFRSEVGRLLVASSDIDARVAFISASSSVWQKMRPTAVRPREHLARLATSRLGIYVWGAHQCLSFKLFEQLAIGLPVIGQSIPQDRANLAGLKGFDEQFRHDEPAALVEAAAAAVNDPQWLTARAESNAAVFDEFLAPEVVAGRLIDVVFGTDRSV